jgi:alpha-amylase/alpha-mannosidase (GH57 family)
MNQPKAGEEFPKMRPTLDVCFVWHFHQPQYQDLATTEAVLPWSRLHCARNYTMMLHMLEEQPAAHVTINLTPVLAAQLVAYAQDMCTDEWLALAQKPAEELDPAQRTRLLELFFDANQQRIIDQSPRYHQLSLRRSDPPAAWSEAEFRDLQCLFTRAWICPSDLLAQSGGAALLEKTRDFTEEEHQRLVRIQQELVRGFLPRLTRLCQSGQVELATSPYAHPILPLLIDTDTAAIVQDTPLPHPPFRHIEDAQQQLVQGKQYVEKLLQATISGCWPSEGSVSLQAVAEIARAGFLWTATDEDILLRQLPTKDRTALYHPYEARTTAGNIAMIFRDRGLSDAIGFQYASMTTENAIGELMSHIRAVRDGLNQTGMIAIIMDGENAWEFYPEGGVPFLRSLYKTLAQEDDVKLSTVSEALHDVPASEMPAFRPGSWIDGNFRVWIGGDEDNKSWQYLRTMREDWAQFSLEERDRSLLSMFAAEGSDWNWWYGRDRTADTAVQFDDLYRRHLMNVYTLAGHSVPDLLLQPILDGNVPVIVVEPTGLMNPHIDGESVSYLDWASGRTLQGESGGGAMNVGARAIKSLRIGYSLSTLYLLLELAQDTLVMKDLKVEVRLSSKVGPAHVVIQREGDKVTAQIDPDGEFAWAFDKTLQIGLPFSTIRAQLGERITFTVLVSGGGRLIATMPARGVIALVLPGPDYELQHWEV